jgi:phage tail tape-measure protein
MVQEGVFHGFWGAAAGGIIGAAIGIISGENIGSAVGKGAAVGAAAGATIGSAKGYDDTDARREIINDLREKSLQNLPVEPQSIASGFLFFPGEAVYARQLRLQLKEKETEKIHVLNFIF